MEDSVWDLYKAHVVRDHLHYRGRVDPSLRCKYCLSCQLRSLAVPAVIPDPLRDEVTDMVCPGNTSPIPALAVRTFRPRSAPPLSTLPEFRSRSSSPDPAKLLKQRPKTAAVRKGWSPCTQTRLLQFRTRVDSLNATRRDSTQTREMRVNFALNKSQTLQHAL